mmetsp:Transcript_6577/g.900  ORF Transcript_6577/g.900 Transcript_6577/m.900 type:complete len:130 (+) Transcript_6577:234-623(+)
MPTLVLKKMFRYTRETNFGSLHIIKNLAIPYAGFGALTGGAWYMWYNLIWAKHSTRGAFWDHLGGYSLFGMAAAAFLFHPKHYWAGFIVGGFLGFYNYYTFHSNNYNNIDTEGYYTQYAEGLSEEEKIA